MSSKPLKTVTICIEQWDFTPLTLRFDIDNYDDSKSLDTSHNPTFTKTQDYTSYKIKRKDGIKS